MKIFFSLLLILIVTTAYGQNLVLVDSLKNEIKRTSSDTLKADLWNQIAGQYVFTQPKKAFIPAHKAESIAQLINYKKGLMDALIRKGVMHYKISNYDSSTYFYQKGLKLALQENDSIMLLKYNRNIALNQSSQGLYDSALTSFLTIYNLYERIDESANAPVLLEIATIYYYLEDYVAALENANKAFELAEKYNNTRVKANALNSKGVFLEELDRTKEAIACYYQSFKLKKQLGDKVGQANSMLNFAAIYTKSKEYNQSNIYLDTVLMLGIETGSKQVQANAIMNKGTNYLKLMQYDQAIKAYLRALSIYQSLGSLRQELLAVSNIANTYRLAGNYKKATEFHRKERELSDSVYSLNMVEKVAEMRTQFETEKKEAENLKLQKENELQALKIELEKKKRKGSILIIILIASLIIGFMLFLFYRFRIIKRHELEQKITEQKARNYVEVIEAEENERVRFARDLHDGLGQLLSSARINMAALEDSINVQDKDILDNSLSLIDQSVSEVRNISHNIMPVSLMRYGLKSAIEDMAKRINDAGKLVIKTDIVLPEKRFNEQAEINIYRLLQEIINNTLKHANASFINVSLKQQNEKFDLFFENNGKKLEINAIERGKGIGWKNIYARINLLNGKIHFIPHPKFTKINIQFSV